MPLAPAVRGIIIASSIVIAASVALYEHPQVREWVDNTARKIAAAWDDFLDSLSPEQRETQRQRQRRDIRQAFSVNEDRNRQQDSDGQVLASSSGKEDQRAKRRKLYDLANRSANRLDNNTDSAVELTPQDQKVSDVKTEGIPDDIPSRAVQANAILHDVAEASRRSSLGRKLSAASGYSRSIRDTTSKESTPSTLEGEPILSHRKPSSDEVQANVVSNTGEIPSASISSNIDLQDAESSSSDDLSRIPTPQSPSMHSATSSSAYISLDPQEFALDNTDLQSENGTDTGTETMSHVSEDLRRELDEQDEDSHDEIMSMTSEDPSLVDVESDIDEDFRRQS